MKNIVFFDFQKDGHHLEYFYHINKNCDLLAADIIYFYVNHDFEVLFNGKFGVEINKRVTLITLSNVEAEIYSNLSKLNKYFYEFKRIKSFLKEFSIDVFFFMDIYPSSFFLWIYKLKCSVSGIYFIPLLKTSKSLVNKFKVIMLSLSLKRNNFGKIFVLNNNKIISELNTQHNVNIFDTISDPILVIEDLVLISEENCLYDFNDKITFLHIGGISVRKGTLVILESLTTLSKTESLQFDVIIAGSTSTDFAQIVKSYIKKLKLLGIKNVHFYNKSLSYLEFDYLLKNCNYVLLPYKIPQMSSGVLNHAINYKKPVIASNKGLMGAIIDEYKVGISIEPDSKAIADKIRKVIEVPHLCDWTLSNDYLEKNSSIAFVKKINILLS
jgi:glycosyltransferase involved in cell wall biosynthesis